MQLLVHHMIGDVSKKEDDDVYGKGVIAYFGDANEETEMLWLVGAFNESRSPTD